MSWLACGTCHPTSVIRHPPAEAGLYDLVIIARKVPPVPISNTTVKLLSADGTMSQGMGEYVVAKSYKPAFFCFNFYYACQLTCNFCPRNSRSCATLKLLREKSPRIWLSLAKLPISKKHKLFYCLLNYNVFVLFIRG